MTTTLNITKDTTSEEVDGFMDELTYQCYHFNRDISPDTTPEQWSKIFANVDLLEQRYQKEGIV